MRDCSSEGDRTDIEEDGSAIALEDRQRLKEYFWREVGEDLRKEHFARTTVEGLSEKLLDHFADHGLSLDDCHDKLKEAGRIVWEISLSLNRHVELDSPKRLIHPFDSNHICDRPKHWTQATPIGGKSLDHIVTEYLRRLWMQHNGLDWCLLRALIQDQIYLGAHEARSGQLFSETDWAYILGAGRFMAVLKYRLLFGTIRFTLTWIALPAAALTALYFERETLAIVLAATFGILLMIKLLLLPSAVSARRKRRKMGEEVNREIALLTRLLTMSQGSVLSPSRFKEVLRQAESKGPLVPHAVHILVDRMIERDPQMFVTGWDSRIS